MKYCIAHAEVVRLWTYWEVEAESYDKAVEKLEQAGNRNAMVSDIMMNGFDESETENEPLEITDADVRPLNLYLKEKSR